MSTLVVGGGGSGGGGGEPLVDNKQTTTTILTSSFTSEAKSRVDRFKRNLKNNKKHRRVVDVDNSASLLLPYQSMPKSNLTNQNQGKQ